MMNQAMRELREAWAEFRLNLPDGKYVALGRVTEAITALDSSRAEGEQAAPELDGYALAGCADRAGVIVRTFRRGDENKIPLAADWNRFAGEVRAALTAPVPREPQVQGRIEWLNGRVYEHIIQCEVCSKRADIDCAQLRELNETIANWSKAAAHAPVPCEPLPTLRRCPKCKSADVIRGGHPDWEWECVACQEKFNDDASVSPTFNTTTEYKAYLQTQNAATDPVKDARPEFPHKYVEDDWAGHCEMCGESKDYRTHNAPKDAPTLRERVQLLRDRWLKSNIHVVYAAGQDLDEALSADRQETRLAALDGEGK